MMKLLKTNPHTTVENYSLLLTAGALSVFTAGELSVFGTDDSLLAGGVLLESVL